MKTLAEYKIYNFCDYETGRIIGNILREARKERLKRILFEDVHEKRTRDGGYEDKKRYNCVYKKVCRRTRCIRETQESSITSILKILIE